ncbi:MAG: hypothetical protein V7607_2564 [Solirubrobacteraceae bacterium]
MSTYTFLRWVRAGSAGAITATEKVGHAGPRATFNVTVHIEGAVDRSTTKALQLHGPGDVVGVSSGQVIRQVPEPGTATADTQVLAHAELDAIDLPWRFTPYAEADGPDAPGFGLKSAGTLTPWMCLVVVERRQGVELSYAQGDLLPVLSIDDAARELPDPASAHAWAHVQLAGAPSDRSPAALDAWTKANPQRTLARVVCPRLLAPETPYLACIVPIYAAGAAAGLGEPPDEDPASTPTPLAYAWSPTASAVRLPVYGSWEFSTGAGGSFEDLVRRLRHEDDLGTLGTRPLELSDPGWELEPDPARAPGALLGALRPVKAVAPWPGDPALVDAVADAIDEVHAVAPPIYGRWHAGAVSVPRAGANPAWLGELNLDPGLRVAAGLGAQVVQSNQETYMAAAWAQAADVTRANQLLRQAQVAIAAGERMHRRHLAPLDPLATLSLVGPALSRLRTATGTGTGTGTATTIHGRLAATCLTPAAFGGAARRILRTRGPLGRRIARLRDDQPFDPGVPLGLLTAGTQPTTPPTLAPLASASAAALDTALQAAGFAARGGDILAERLARLQERGASSPCPPVTDLDGLSQAARAGTDPALTVPRRARARLSMAPGTWDPPDRIDPVMIAPEITTPLFEALRALDPEWVLPGLDGMPPNSVGAVAVNQRFVEAFLVGANHEMSRELLWRGYPTDQRGSVFRVFWDRRGTTRPDGRDIAPIDSWSPTSSIATHEPNRPPATSPERFVLLLRGDLLARFPDTAIFCVRARWEHASDGSAHRVPEAMTATSVALPAFGGRFAPDVAFSAFDFDLAQARGDPPDAPGIPAAGWFVVMQEQPTEPRFGIAAEVGATAALSSWRDLGTPLVQTAGGRTAGSPSRPVGYLDLTATTQSQAFVDAVGALTPAWDGRSDSLAATLLLSPFRLYLHATDLIGEPEAPPA